MGGRMIESSTYRYILQKGFEEGERKGAVKSILNVLDARFHIGTDQTLQLSLEGIEDLQRLKSLLRTAAQTESFAAFMQTLVNKGK